MKHAVPIIYSLAMALGALVWFDVVGLGAGMPSDIGKLIVALVLLVLGADFMVHGAVRLARRMGVSPFFIGVTVVAFGTSAPELAASVGAALKDSGGLAVGNVLGSNIANICLILGVTALISPVPIERSIWRVDAPLMFILTVLASLTMIDVFYPAGGQFDGAGRPLISRIDAGLLLAGLAWYIWFNARSGRIDPNEIEHEIEIEMAETGAQSAERDRTGLKGCVQLIVGLAGLVLGADLLVDSASAIAITIGVSEAAVGLTVVAFGTSLPELVFSARAAMKGHAEIAVGNIIGSNVFNLLSVLGIAAMVRQIPVPADATRRDIWVVWGVSLMAMIVMKTHARVTRLEGAVLLAGYAAYTYWVYRG